MVHNVCIIFVFLHSSATLHLQKGANSIKENLIHVYGRGNTVIHIPSSIRFSITCSKGLASCKHVTTSEIFIHLFGSFRQTLFLSDVCLHDSQPYQPLHFRAVSAQQSTRAQWRWPTSSSQTWWRVESLHPDYRTNSDCASKTSPKSRSFSDMKKYHWEEH